MQRKLATTITSWPFGFSLLALLLNDGWLKTAYPGILSGKLSDFAGIAVVALLLLSVFPRRPFAVYGGMAAAFAWWKSSLSQSYIDAINASLHVTIGRTVDYTDLLALLIVPLCHKAVVRDNRKISWPLARRLLIAPLVAATIFGLMATSVIQTRQEYVVRQVDTAPELSKRSMAEVVSAVAEKHGLACESCSELPNTAAYRGDGISMSYAFLSSNAIAFKISAVPTGLFFGPSGREKADRFRSDLKEALASRFQGLEYVERLGTQ